VENTNEGRIQQLRGRLQGAWGDLTDDDVDRAQGNIDNLVGIVKEKTGESEGAIRERIDQLMGEGEETEPSSQ